MATVVFSNFASTVLAAPLPSNATSFSVQPTTGSLFPATTGGNWFYCVLSDSLVTPTVREIVKVTGISGDTLTVVRGQDGTTAQTFGTAPFIELRLVNQALLDLAQSSPVSSFNGRTGAITLLSSDVTTALGFSPVQSVAGKTGVVTLVVGDVSGAAPLASPNLTGVPTAPTATPGTNTTQLATTAFVTTAVGASGVTSFNGRTGVVTLAVTDLTGPLVGYANVKAYGAVGDGVADDTSKIQAAINSGFPVFFPPGIYRITSALTATNVDLTLYGAGANASIVKVDGAFDGLTFSGTRATYDVHQLTVENLAFLSNNTGALNAIHATWTGIGSSNFRTLHVRNVEVQGMAGDASFLRCLYLIGSDNASIQHCYFSTFESQSGLFRTSSAGIEIISTSSVGTFETDISDCTFLECQTAVKYNADATATNNNCQGLFVNHCHIINCQNGVVAGNTAAVPAGPVIEPEVNVIGCFIGTQFIGVDIQAQAQWIVADNLFYSTAGIPNWIGVRSTSVSGGGYQVDGRIRGNTFIDLGAGGTTLGVSVVGNAGAHESILVDGNTFEACTHSAQFDANTDSAQYTYTNLVISGGAASDLGTGNFIDAKGQTTPVPTAGSGAFTTVSAVVDYEKIGRFAKCRVTITDTANGAAASWINLTMPFTATSESVFYGRCISSGNMAQGIIPATSNVLTVLTYNNLYPGATGERITLEGMIFV